MKTDHGIKKVKIEPVGVFHTVSEVEDLLKKGRHIERRWMDRRKKRHNVRLI